MVTHQIARFVRPTLGPPGPDRTQVGPMLYPWTLWAGRIPHYWDLHGKRVRTQAMCSVLESPLNRIPAQPHPSYTAALWVAFVPPFTQCFQVLISFHTLNLSWFRCPIQFYVAKKYFLQFFSDSRRSSLGRNADAKWIILANDFNSLKPRDAYMRRSTNHHWFRKRLVAWMKPSHCLNQWWDIVSWSTEK